MSDDSGGGGGCGCVSWIIAFAVLWFIFFGATINGHHYQWTNCTSDGVNIERTGNDN